jgi:hypothetical protein
VIGGKVQKLSASWSAQNAQRRNNPWEQSNIFGDFEPWIAASKRKFPFQMKWGF